jgi:hypothetical protein
MIGFMVGACIAALPLTAQTHGAVPVDKPIYHILEQAVLRGLCAPLPGAKPYSRAVVLSAIAAILDSEYTADSGNTRFGKLSDAERLILEEAQKTYGRAADPGLDWQRGVYHFESALGKNAIRSSGEVGFNLESTFAGGIYPSGGDTAWGTGNWISAFFKGDMGEHFSYGFTLAGAVLHAPPIELGKYWTYYDGYGDGEGSYSNQHLTTYRDPLAYFPYTYKKRWDGFVFSYTEISTSGHTAWPDDMGLGYTMLPELSGSLLDGHITYRWARLDREWGAMAEGRSLMLNKAAQPFLALEATAQPFPWLTFSTLTGVLEYFNEKGIKTSAATNQNAFSMTMLEFNYKQYIHLDIGSSAVWPKRFELGYLFPLANEFLYQNNIGDFDNLGMFFNAKGQYPGIANLWFSFFLDELNITEEDLFEKDRSMFAFQIGTSAAIPWLPFASVTLSYTKIEPYCYTHTREFVPWYDNTAMMEMAYTNNGRGLGYYLPPNADELLLRFEAMPSTHTVAHLQYQMIRHGADYGGSAVDGSSFVSELDPNGRSTNPVLRKYFLKDGAYQWQHVFKFGAEHTFAQLTVPFQLFGEVGVVFSYFTNIDGPANSGSPSSYSVIDTAEYPKSTGIIATIGFKLFL